VRELDRIVELRGCPRMIVSDNGTELTSNAILSWRQEHDVEWHFFEWKAIKGQKAKQPYAIAMKNGAPFGLAGIWENWKEPASAE
jgi:hypothetical protein